MISRRRFTLGLAAATLLGACGPASPALPVAPTPEPSVRVSGSDAVTQLLQRLSETYREHWPEVALHIDTGTNSGAIQGVLKGTLDLAAIDRPLTEGERQRDQLVYRPIARDAVAFAGRAPEGIDRLTLNQVRAIYLGRVTDWAHLGGPPGPIMVLDRDEDEPARDLIVLPLLERQPIQARTIVLAKAGEMLQTLDNVPNSFGYTSLGLLRLARPRYVRLMEVDGRRPSRAALEAGGYPWHLTFGLVHRADAGPAVRHFVDYVLGAEGRTLMEALDVAAPVA
jgi:phosphate transport system substrate-binding protein